MSVEWKNKKIFALAEKIFVVFRNSKLFASRAQADHLAEVLAGQFSWSVHHTGMGGPTADQKFYDPAKVKEYTGSIRFKDPERTVPVVV